MQNLILIRGLPGSGKTTFANIIAPDSNVAADEFFVDADGVYTYDPSRLSSAHAWCLSVCEYFMQKERDVIAVHNTFVENWQMKPYFKLAKRHAYKVTVIKMEQQFISIHDVPERSMNKMRLRWEDFLE